MCADGPCAYPRIPGMDIDINGDVWPGSDFERHLTETRTPASPNEGNEWMSKPVLIALDDGRAEVLESATSRHSIVIDREGAASLAYQLAQFLTPASPNSEESDRDS